MIKLKELRNSFKFSQAKMAKKLGVSLSMYEKVETGRTRPSRAFMEKVKFFFPQVSIDEIFFANEQQQNCFKEE